MIPNIEEMVRIFRSSIITLIMSSDAFPYEKIDAFTASSMGFLDSFISYPEAIDNLEDKFIKSLKQKGLYTYKVKNHLYTYSPDKGQTIYYKDLLETLAHQLPKGEIDGMVTLFSYQDEKLEMLYSDIVQLFYEYIFTKQKIGFRWDW